MFRKVSLLVATALFSVGTVLASIFGSVRGIVHDPQHRPIAGAQVTLQANNSAFKMETTTNAEGVFEFSAVPLGQYTATVEAKGFAQQAQSILVVADSAPVLHYLLVVATTSQQVNVIASAEEIDTDSPRRDLFIDQTQISRYAGVDSSNSFKIITGFVPGSYMVHDQVHVRGGHQITWAIDGVPVPNTNIASNVGPQFNPKDVSYLQAETGSYAAEYGDRIYGVFNVAPKNGFERRQSGRTHRQLRQL